MYLKALGYCTLAVYDQSAFLLVLARPFMAFALYGAGAATQVKDVNSPHHFHEVGPHELCARGGCFLCKSSCSRPSNMNFALGSRVLEGQFPFSWRRFQG